MHILIISARFYDGINDALETSARKALEHAGATHETITVPGALEIPAAIRLAIESRHYDGYVALGCVIRGETSHYETVCEESARGLTWLATEFQAAIGNGILTVETEDQAHARLGKGAGAAEAALTLIQLKKKWNLSA